MKKIIILVLLLLILGGGGYAGYTFFLAPPPEGEEAHVEKPSSDPVFTRIPPLVVPVVSQDNRPETLITLSVTLEVDGQGTALAIQSQNPRLVDAFITALYGALNDQSVMDGKLVNIPMVKQKLQDAADKVLGRGVVRQVLVQTMTRRNL